MTYRAGVPTRDLQRLLERRFGAIKITHIAGFPSFANRCIAQCVICVGVLLISFQQLLIVSDLIVGPRPLGQGWFEFKESQRDQRDYDQGLRRFHGSVSSCKRTGGRILPPVPVFVMALHMALRSTARSRYVGGHGHRKVSADTETPWRCRSSSRRDDFLE